MIQIVLEFSMQVLQSENHNFYNRPHNTAKEQNIKDDFGKVGDEKINGVYEEL